MLVPLAGRILQSHVDNSPGTLMEITIGAMQNTKDTARDDTVLLYLAERDRVKLTETRMESSPAATNQ